MLRRIGDELISSETVAVIELVKNAYDADATRVLVRFQGPLEIGQGRIEVMDNGHGMSLETIQTPGWNRPRCSESASSAASSTVGVSWERKASGVLRRPGWQTIWRW